MCVFFNIRKIQKIVLTIKRLITKLYQYKSTPNLTDMVKWNFLIKQFYDL